MYFKIQPLLANSEREWSDEDRSESAVYAVSPKFGNDAALIAVFDHPEAAQELADILNHAATLLSWAKNPETMGK